MSSPEHHVRHLPPIDYSVGDRTLHFDINGQKKGVAVKISGLSRRLVAEMSDAALDLIEIAALVYAADASVTRGGPTDPRLAQAWYRRFNLEVPIRSEDLWTDPEVKQELEETLSFLSGDRWSFDFRPFEARPPETRYFDLGTGDGWTADTVVLFSGGLDSFAGALEEIVERGNTVALVSHFSATKIAPVQRELAKAMASRLGNQRLRHFPTRVQLTAGTNREGTHRTRSFLFAALGIATASMFGRKAISFHENGVVSLNLPPVGNVLSTRATRTTHPQTLQRFQALFSNVFRGPIRVDNPLFWRTKTEIVRKIADLGMAGQIRHTRSCADVHNQTTQHPHCGCCTQCIDRRFAVLAAGLEAEDPGEAYRCDLMEGVRSGVRDKEAALSYVRNALFFDAATPTQLEQAFPAILNAIAYVKEPVGTSLLRLTDLFARHGREVTGVMRKTLDAQRRDLFPQDSLPWLYGDIQTAAVSWAMSESADTAHSGPQPASQIQLAFDRRRKKLLMNEIVEITGAGFRLLLALADQHLRGLGQGLDPLEYPLITAMRLAKELGFSNDATVRKSVNRTRNLIAKKFESVGLDPDQGRSIIDNHPWHGYRLDPERAVVRMTDHS